MRQGGARGDEFAPWRLWAHLRADAPGDSGRCDELVEADAHCIFEVEVVLALEVPNSGCEAGREGGPSLTSCALVGL